MMYNSVMKAVVNIDTNKYDKAQRVLSIYTQLLNSHLVIKSQIAINFNVDERSIQRDIDDIRNYLEVTPDNNGFYNTIVYDRNKKGYRL